MSKARIIHLDLMRFLGVLIIMVAHANPPQWLFQLRNFGTPLLIVASALTHAYIYSTRELSLISFYKKRLFRLIVPAWTFLAFFFVAFFLAGKALNEGFPFTVSKIVSSFTFYKGIGYVWIFKVYIFLALITPAAIKIRNSKMSDAKYFLSLLGLYLVYELVLTPLMVNIPPTIKPLFI